MSDSQSVIGAASSAVDAILSIPAKGRVINLSLTYVVEAKSLSTIKEQLEAAGFSVRINQEFSGNANITITCHPRS